MSKTSDFFVVLGAILIASHYFPSIDLYLRYHGYQYFLIFVVWKIATNTWRWIPQKKLSAENKAVLITGCDSGFGHELARRLYTKGYKVYAACLFGNGKGALQLKESCPDSYRMHIIQMDVTKKEDIQAAFQYVKDTLDDCVLWGLVNNAGICTYNILEFTDISVYRQTMEVNALGPVEVTLAFLPLIRKSRGRIVFVSSLAARFVANGLSAYSMSKAANTNFAQSVTREVERFGIKVITIEPSVYKTPLSLNVRQESRATLVRNLEKLHKNPELEEAYGEEFLDRFLSVTEEMTQQYSNNKIYQVIDSMESAISDKDPQLCYHCHGLRMDTLMYISLVLMPTEILNYFMEIYRSAVFGRQAGAPKRLKLHGPHFAISVYLYKRLIDFRCEDGKMRLQKFFGI